MSDLMLHAQDWDDGDPESGRQFRLTLANSLRELNVAMYQLREQNAAWAQEMRDLTRRVSAVEDHIERDKDREIEGLKQDLRDSRAATIVTTQAHAGTSYGSVALATIANTWQTYWKRITFWFMVGASILSYLWPLIHQHLAWR